MKKHLAILVILLFLCSFSQAQVNSHAFGFRFADSGHINGVEFSYQQGLSNMNRMEFDVGFGGYDNRNRLYGVGIFHWVFNLSGGLNFFVGPGAGVGLYNTGSNQSYVNVAVVGQLGFEYNFNHLGVPLMLSLDSRPLWNFFGEHHGLGWGNSFAIRYTW